MINLKVISLKKTNISKNSYNLSNKTFSESLYDIEIEKNLSISLEKLI